MSTAIDAFMVAVAIVGWAIAMTEGDLVLAGIFLVLALLEVRDAAEWRRWASPGREG